MHFKPSLTIGLALAAIVSLTNPANAQKVDPNKNLIAKGPIEAIDKKEKTITVKIQEGSGTGKDRQIEVAGNTKIEKDNKTNLYLKDLRQGDVVNVMYKKVKEQVPGKPATEVFKALKIQVLSSAEAPPPATK